MASPENRADIRNKIPARLSAWVDANAAKNAGFDW